MKTKFSLVAAVLTLGAALPGWAKDLPIGPGEPLSSIRMGHESGPKGAKKTVAIPGSLVKVGVWYRNCPVMTNVILNSKHESEVILSNGKRIMLSSAGLKDVVEADLKKYESYMY